MGKPFRHVEKQTKTQSATTKQHTPSSPVILSVVKRKVVVTMRPLPLGEPKANLTKNLTRPEALRAQGSRHINPQQEPRQRPNKEPFARSPKTRHKPRNFEVNKAGWRGPWAAPPFFEEPPQETLIPRGFAAPHQGYALGVHQHQHRDLNKLCSPEERGLALSPLLFSIQRTGTDLTIQPIQYTHQIISHNTTRIIADRGPNTETRKSGFQGRPRGGGQAIPPQRAERCLFEAFQL